MSCNQTLSGLVKDCSPSMGGILEVLLANRDDVASVQAETGKISGITMEASAKLKKYTFARNTGSMTSTYTIDQASGVKYVTTDLVLQFNRMETTKRDENTAHSVNDPVATGKATGGVNWYLGYDEPVNASAGDGQTGTARGDANRYSITLQDISKEMPMEVDASVIEGIL